MVCPKCGREYEGTKCPNCDGLDIIVNQDDYLKRRREYEEKQAVLKSASSDNEEKNKSNEALKPDEILDKIVKAGGQARKKIVDKKAEKTQKEKKKKKKTVIIGIVISIIVVLAGAVGTYMLINHKEAILYTIYDNIIYRISETDMQQVCNYDEVLFESDNNSFHIQSIPQQFRDRTIKESMASSNGKYYCAFVYNHSSNNYSIILWNNENSNILAENNKEKKLLYIDNDGYVIYQETEVINEEGSVGTTQLYISKVESDHNITTTMLSETVKDIYVYSDKKAVIFNDLDGKLYTYVYGKNPKKQLIAQDVTTVYGAVKDCIHLFSYKAQQVNTLKDCNGFIYTCNDSVYYYQFDFNDGNSIYLGKNNDANLTYIIDKNDVIMANKNTLMCAKIVDKAIDTHTEIKVIDTYTEIAKLGTLDNIIYDSNSKSVIFVNDNSSLMYYCKGKVTNISDEVTDGTLNWIANIKGAFTYVCNQAQMYCKNVKTSPVRLAEEENIAQNSEVFYQKGKLYFINIEGKLYVCSGNGNNCNMIGDANRIILGK